MDYKSLRKALLVAGLTMASPVLAADMASTEMLSNTCAGCHGTGGNSNGPATPGIAGLSKGYFIGAMLAYKYGDDEDAVEQALGRLPSSVEAEDIYVLPRTATVMDRIAKGYTEAEIVAMADYFSSKEFVRHKQQVDAGLARKGDRIHDKECEKCHEDDGTTSVDDVGLLAGQWAPYLRATLMDFHNGDREMPKKMRAKMKDLSKDDLEALVNFYAGYEK